MSEAGSKPTDHRWPRQVYAGGSEPDPRFTFANERTFLAWIRTGLGFIAAGVAIVAVARLNASLGLEVRIASALLVACGLICGVSALTRWMVNEHAMRHGRPLPSSRVLLVITGTVATVGVIALIAVALA